MDAYPVSAVSWGDWRASFEKPLDDGRHQVQLRRHRTSKRGVLETLTTSTDDPTEAGLRAAIFAHVNGDPLAPVSTLADANPAWFGRLADEPKLKRPKAKRKKVRA